jgi:hypothetical protein
MFKNTIRSLTVAAGLVAALGMTIGTAGTAFAANSNSPGTSNNTTATLTLTGGTLNILAPDNLAFANTLDGTTHATVTNSGTGSGVFSLAVVDATGSGAGWHVQLSATTFTGATTPNKLADIGTLSVTHVAETMTDLTGTDTSGVTIDPGVTAGSAHTTSGAAVGPVAITTAASSPTPATIYNTASASGMGSFALNTTLNLDLPSNTKADTYTSTITVAAVTAIA